MSANIWAITDTYSLMSTVENIQKPATYLADTFFPNPSPIFYTTKITVEYRSEGRLLAPYVVPGTRGVNINRGTSNVAYYTAPQFGPRRVISLRDVEQRQFGETPIFSTVLPEQRAAGFSRFTETACKPEGSDSSRYFTKRQNYNERLCR